MSTVPIPISPARQTVEEEGGGSGWREVGISLGLFVGKVLAFFFWLAGLEY